METKQIKKKNNHIFIVIASIWLLFSCISIIRAFNESKLYDTLAWKTSIDTESVLGQKITKIQNTLQAQQAVSNQDYTEALQLISWNTSEDYYNRGTIQTLLAYQNALQSSISWLQRAQVFVAQAQQSFDLAKKLSTNKTITSAIIENQTTIDSLSSVVDIKTCYGVGQAIISHISDITDTIQNIKSMFNEEEVYINKRANSLDTKCYEWLRYILDTSKEQIGLFQLQMENNKHTYISDFSDKIENPMICIETPYENILPSMIKGKQWIDEYQQLHQNTIDALKSNDAQRIQELCNQSKNDAQINQQIESSVQELLQKLEDNKRENQTEAKANNQEQYKDFFDEDEKKELQEIQKINQWRIDTMLHIKGKWNYDPEKYIDDMFNQFYGNSGDFINLHK